MQELQRKGLFPADGTLQEFVKQYGNKEALTSLHTDLVSKEILDDSVADFDSFVTGFELSEVVTPTVLGGDDPFETTGLEEPSIPNTPQSIASDLDQDLQQWYQGELEKLTLPNGAKIPQYDAALKRLNAELNTRRLDNASVNMDNIAQQQIIPYLGGETSNPIIEISDPSEVVSEQRAGEEFVYGGQSQLEDRYNRQTTDAEAKPQTGIHSWMFTESNVNLKPYGAPSSQGVKDTEYKLANKLWTISDEFDGSIDKTLVPVLERQYPGYEFKSAREKGLKKAGTLNNIHGIPIEVTAPNGEKTTIHGGLDPSGVAKNVDLTKTIEEQKVKLANFINTHGIDLTKVKSSIQSTAQRYNDLLAKPYNEKKVSLGGIGLDLNQQATADSYGIGEYIEDENGTVSYKFEYNPALFHDNSYEDYLATNGEELISRGVITQDELSNPDSEETKSKIKKDILVTHGEYGDDRELQLPNYGPKAAGYKAIIHDIDFGNKYMAFSKGSKAWDNTVKALAPAYNAAGVDLDDETIKTHIAQKEHNKYVNGALDANLNEYLWKSDNDNKTQALFSVAAIVTKDVKLNQAMALQGLNEAAIDNYNKPTPDLAIVDMFEETYNDPSGSFNIEGLSEDNIVTLRNGKQVSKKDFNGYVAAKSRRNNQMTAMLDRRSKAWELQDEVGDIDANIKLLEKNYNAWSSSLATLGLGFSDIGTGLLYLGGKAAKYTPVGAGATFWLGQAANAFTEDGNFLTDFWDEWDKEWADQYDDYSFWKEGIKSQYGKEVGFHRDRFGRGGAFSPGNFGRFVAQETSKQIPILATMIASGGTAAPWVIGAYSAGQHWADADRKEYVTGKVENEFIQGMQSIGYGAAEGIFERLTTVPILRRGGKLVQGLGEPSMLSYRNAMKQYFKENGAFLVSSPIAESAAEFGTQITQNAIDGRPIMENVDHAAFVGGMFGHAMSITPFMSGLAARQFSDYNSFSEYKNRQQEINELEQELVYETQRFAIPQDIASIKMKQKVIDDLKVEQKAFVEEKFAAIQNTMTNSAYNNFEEALNEQADISEVVNDMLSVDNTNTNNKLLQVYKDRFDNLQYKRDVWRSAANFSNQFTLLETSNKERYDRTVKQAKAQLAKDNVGNVRDDQVLPLAEEIYVGELIDENFESVAKNKSKGKRYLKFDTNGEALTYIEDVLATSKEKINAKKDLTDEQKKSRIVNLERQIRDVKDNVNKKETKGAITSLLEGRLSGWNMTFDADGILTTDPAAIKRSEVLGFRENAIRNNETQIFTHEAGHDIFGELLGYDSKEFKPLADEIISYMSKTNPMLLKGLALKRGRELQKSDEVVMNFLELVGQKKINIEDKQGGLLSSSFGFITNNIFKNNNKPTMEFNGQNGAIKFLHELGTAVSEGRVTPEMVAKWKREGVIQGAKKKYQKAQRQYKKLIEESAIALLDENIDNYKFSDTKDVEDANQIMKDLLALVADNKVTPVKNYEAKKAALTAKYQKLKSESSVVETVPIFEGSIRDESDAARKERVNLIERSFRGRLETAQGGRPMGEILRAYEGKIEALFKKGGYYATDSYQRFQDISEALEEFTAITNVELMKSIRAFKPDVNKDFDAYIMSPKILPNKVKLANKIIGRESKNEGFDTGLEAASGVAVSEDTTLEEFETTLREVLGVKKGDPMYEAAMTAVQDVMQKGLPKFEYTQRKKSGGGETVTLAQVRKTLSTNPTGEAKRQAERDLAGIMKKVKSELEASYQQALDKTIKQEFLKAKVYDSFLKEHRTELLKRLPIEDLVALERLVKPESKIFTSVRVMDKQTGRTVLNPTEVKQYEGSGNLTTATTTQGPTLYNRKNPSEKQFVDFFNVRGRKNALAKILSNVLGLDATMQNITSEKVVNEVAEGNPQIKEQLGEQALKDFALSIGRGTAFKFSMAESVGMEGRLAEDYNKLQPNILDLIIDMNVSDPMSVNLAVDVVLSEGKYAPYRSAIKKNLKRFLRPYAKAVDSPGEIQIDINEYITRELDRTEDESIQRMWNSKPMAQAFANPTDVVLQREFDNRTIQQELLNKAGYDSKGNQNPVTEQIKIDQAALEVRYMARIQSGVEVVSKKARNMLYQNISSFKADFLKSNFGFKDYNTFNVKDKNGKSTRYLEFIREDGSRTKPVVFPTSPSQKVELNMIDGSMTQAEVDFREKMADEAWNFVVNKYKAAKEVVENDSADELNIAMLMAGMGSMMKGPIRAAAPFRYRPVDAPFTTLKDSDGNKNFEYEHGIPAKIVNLLIADAVFNPDSDVNLQKLKDSYAIGAIPVDMNENFSTFFGDRMQDTYKVGDIAPTRWYNEYTRGRAAYAVEDVRTKERFGEKEAQLWKEEQQAANVNKFSLSNDVVDMDGLKPDEILNYAATIDKALQIARDPNAPVKKIRVFDFDDTLATTKSNVLYTMPDGTTGKLTAEEFAKKGDEMVAQGVKWDFSEFNKVMQGGKGPLLGVAKLIQQARGTKDVFVLTARSQEAAPAIKEFLDSVGLKIPLKNITGLGNSSPFAKSRWVIEKAADGYNDFYFADDHMGNVKAVEDALSVIDVKSKVQQAKFKFSESVDRDFNIILEHSLGIEWFKDYSKAKGEMLGKQNQKRKIHPYSAEDFEGLIYPLLGKGKRGDSNYKWFEEHLFKPFSRAMTDLDSARINLMDDFRALKKTLIAPKTIKKINSTGFTNENSIRVFVWDKLGKTIPGLSKIDLAEINKEIENNPELKLFAEELIKINKGEYKEPGKHWLAGTITTDLYEGLNTIKRAEYLKQWKENVDIIFSDKNLNKLESKFGPKYIEALKNSLRRMESGSNRSFSNNRLTNQVLDYLNNAQGVVMFLNMRSALLQGISNVNFLNWSFNNPLKAGVAFGNMPQYSKDFIELMNSDYLVNRRGGLSMDIHADEVANSAKTSKNKAKAIISYIIEKGYTPTKFMDSFAIASGGATFYRNRINDLVKKGLSEEEARAQAYEEFVEISEKNQQSSRPDKISSQQASTLGRLTLNWANTQMQYVRIQKKAIQDIANNRGDFKTNVSRIVYYGVVQNLWFQMAHSAMFALAFGEDDDDPTFKEDKIERTANGAADNILRGLGIGGHVFSVLKNMGIKIYKESEKDRPRYADQLWELFKLSPVISSKVNRLKQAAWQFDSKKRRQEMIDKGFALDNPAYEAGAKVVSAVTNIPVDRLLIKMQNIGDALSEETDAWMDIALLLGWPRWTLEAKKKETSKWGPTKDKKKDSWGPSGYKKEKSWGPQK